MSTFRPFVPFSPAREHEEQRRGQEALRRARESSEDFEKGIKGKGKGKDKSQDQVKDKSHFKGKDKSLDLLAQVYGGCERVPVREMLELQKRRLEKKIEELKKELLETTMALEDLADAHQEVEAQLKHVQTQTLSFTELNSASSGS